MTPGDPIKLRLDPKTHLAFQQAANLAGKPLATYLREHLATHETISREITALREETASSLAALRRDITAVHARTETLENNGAILHEILLMLRVLCPEARLRAVHEELRRRGVQIWARR